MLTRFAAVAAALLAAPMALADDDIAGDVDRGIDAYDASCVECHARPERVMRGVEGDDEARAEWLDDFLVDHYAEDDQDRADIIAYLLDL